MANTATRLIHLILLLQRRPGQKARELAGELDISIRSLHRYLGMLDEMGIPVYSERGPNGGFSLVRGYRMPPLVFTPEEAVALALGAGLVEEVWGQLYRDAARSALARLENVLPEAHSQEIAWARASLVATGLHRSSLAAVTPALESLRGAIRERRQVQIRYGGRGPQPAESRAVDPYALVHRSGYWYLVGYCHLRRALRTFRVDRIEALEPLEAEFPPPEGFDLRAYLQNEPLGQPQTVARLRFSPEGAAAAYESRVLWQDFAEQPDGSVLVSYACPSLEWAASTVLSFGPLIEALGPPELRNMIRAYLRNIQERYLDPAVET